MARPSCPFQHTTACHGSRGCGRLFDDRKKTWSRDDQANEQSIYEVLSQTLPLTDRLSTSSSLQDDGSGVDLGDTNVLAVEETLHKVAVHWPNTITTGHTTKSYDEIAGGKLV